MLLDLGNGALGALQHYIGLYDVDAVLLSHLHADHCLDLCSYFVARTYHPQGAFPAIPVYGPAGTADHMARAYGLELQPGMRNCFDFRVLMDGVHDIGPFRVTAARMNHPVEAYGVRVEHGGRVLTYSGDTGETSTLSELARDADMLLCEASFQEGMQVPVDMHLTGRQAAEHAHRAGARQLVLTHLVPWYDETRTLDDAHTSGYVGDVELARAGARYELA